jgi:GNAT superfamily N-acetyltransferase
MIGANSPTGDLSFQRITQPDVRIWNAVEPIYTSSFPLNEQVPFPFLMRMIEHGWKTLFTAASGGEILGFATTSALAHKHLHFLSYLAVDTSKRSRGAGGQLFRFVLEDLRHSDGVSELIWEVERVLSKDPEEKRAQERRIAFYEKNGAVLLDAVRGYSMPSMSGDGTIPTWLMWAAADPSTPPPSGQRLRDYVKDIYASIYRRDENDPTTQSILRSIVD